MLNSSNFNTTFPFFYEDNNNNNIQPSDEIINPFYYYDHIQSPLYYYDVENYVELLNNNNNNNNNNDFGLTMIQEPLQATNSSVVTDDKMDLSTKGGDNDRPIVSSNRGVKRRRTSNKDRHSKIRTAHGLRDRRMRLSLEVARPFFELQDILGYDKASRTVKWLLNQSKIAIDELIVSKIGSSPSGVTKCTTISSISDCDEGESIVVDQKNNNNNNNINNNKGKKPICIVNNNVAKEGKNNNNNKEKRLRTTKEAMKKARDKARKRTLEKIQSRRIIIKENEVKSHPLVLGGCEVIEGNNDANSMNHINGNSLGGGGDFVDVSLMQNWNSSTNFNY